MGFLPLDKNNDEVHETQEIFVVVLQIIVNLAHVYLAIAVGQGITKPDHALEPGHKVRGQDVTFPQDNENVRIVHRLAQTQDGNQFCAHVYASLDSGQKKIAGSGLDVGIGQEFLTAEEAMSLQFLVIAGESL